MYCWSINPETLQVVVKDNIDRCYLNILKEYNGVKINIDKYENTINNLKHHYNKFISTSNESE